MRLSRQFALLLAGMAALMNKPFPYPWKVYDVIQLYKALGGGWKACGDREAAPALSGTGEIHDAE